MLAAAANCFGELRGPSQWCAGAEVQQTVWGSGQQHECLLTAAQVSPYRSTSVSSQQHKCLLTAAQVSPYSSTSVSLQQHKCLLTAAQVSPRSSSTFFSS
ncbi:hypothetical protein Emag_002591 [Eimeria magna]